MQQDSVTPKTRKTPVRRSRPDIKNEESSTFAGLKTVWTESLAGLDEDPLQFIRENPVRATLFGVLVGMLLGAALSKRAVTK